MLTFVSEKRREKESYRGCSEIYRQYFYPIHFSGKVLFALELHFLPRK